MKKYQELVRDYAGTIARIKDLERQKEEARKALVDMNPDDPGYIDTVELHAYLDEDIVEEKAHLDFIIRDEYAGVPYRQRRQEGIAGFYREAGLN